MLRPSRDWRESMTLSSRDPHFGQRIVSEHSLSHNTLWRQCVRIAFPHAAFSDGHTLSHRKSLAETPVTQAYSATPSKGANYAAAALGGGIFFFDFGCFF